MPATKLSIYQEALRLFGDARLDVILDDTESRYAMDDAFPGVIDYCLRAAAWRFAMKTGPLAVDTGPLPGFDIAYSRPADWLRTHALFVLAGALERPIDIREQGVKFSSNTIGVQLRWVSSDYADPELPGNPWPEHFAKAVAAHLGFSVADRLTNSASASVRMSQLYGSLMAEAIVHDAIPENPWLRHQLDGSFQEGLLYVLTLGYWNFALKTSEFTAPPITMPPPLRPIIGYPYSYSQPADLLRTHAYFVPAGDGREHPIDIKEDGEQWSTTAPYFAVRYVSSERGFDPLAWPEQFLVTLQSWLRVGEAPETPPPQSNATQAAAPGAAFRAILAAALQVEAEPENRWYRFQRNGTFLDACFHVAETGRWKFAIATLNLEADATLNDGNWVDGTLPANVYGDGSISPSYAAVTAKPVDWLRTINMYRVEHHGMPHVDGHIWPDRIPIDFRDEGGNWHTNWRFIQVRYLKRAVIESWRWPRSYANAVLAWLEYEEARTDPKATAIATAKQRIYEDMVDKAAKSDDSQEFPPYRTVGRLVRGRFSRVHGRGANDFMGF